MKYTYLTHIISLQSWSRSGQSGSMLVHGIVHHGGEPAERSCAFAALPVTGGTTIFPLNGNWR